MTARNLEKKIYTWIDEIYKRYNEHLVLLKKVEKTYPRDEEKWCCHASQMRYFWGQFDAYRDVLNEMYSLGMLPVKSRTASRTSRASSRTTSRTTTDRTARRTVKRG